MAAAPCAFERRRCGAGAPCLQFQSSRARLLDSSQILQTPYTRPELANDDRAGPGRADRGAGACGPGRAPRGGSEGVWRARGRQRINRNEHDIHRRVPEVLALAPQLPCALFQLCLVAHKTGKALRECWAHGGADDDETTAAAVDAGGASPALPCRQARLHRFAGPVSPGQPDCPYATIAQGHAPQSPYDTPPPSRPLSVRNLFR